ncbi:proteasome-interacting protein cic1 [Tilletia horrida]|nr:proteasome-interacting protein cic1 [Tilletia horrida]
MARAPRSKVATAKASPAAAKKQKVAATEESAAAPVSATTKGKAKQSDAALPLPSQKLIDRRVNSGQALKAINALISHKQKRLAAGADDDQLLPPTPTARDDILFLQLTLKRIPAPTTSAPAAFTKPIRVPLPHSLLQPNEASVCLIVKDPQREYKDLLTSLGIRSIARVVGVTKLKGKFAPFDARRQLMNDHDLFLVDERVVSLMPRLLGKKWMESKKPPIPVKLTHTRHLAEELDKAIGSTYYIPNRGTCLTLRIGSLAAHTPTQLVENLEAALPSLIQRLKPISSSEDGSVTTEESPDTRSRWNNVQAIDLKTGSSAALPIWTSSLADRWTGMEEESAKAKEVREAKAVKEAARKQKLAAKKERKLLKGAKAVAEAMGQSDDDEDEDEDDDIEDVAGLEAEDDED